METIRSSFRSHKSNNIVQAVRMIKPDLNNNYFNEQKFKPNKPMLFTPLLRRRMKSPQIKYFLLWLLSILLVIWFMSSSLDSCNNREHTGQIDASQFAFQRVNDNINDPDMLGADAMIDRSDIYPYSRNTPLIFVGGVPRYVPTNFSFDNKIKA